jgi:cytochrome c oxidase subunit 3
MAGSLASREASLASGEPPQVVAEHFNTLAQQHEAVHLGMWLFLATEVMMFGGLFTGYTVYRILYPLGFGEGSRHLDLTLASVNTIILLISSFVMSFAVQAARVGNRRILVILLSVTALLGVAFMAIKAAEYAGHFNDGMVPGLNWQYAGPRQAEVQLFMLAYFTMTGLHAVHLTVAIVIVLIMLVGVIRSRLQPLQYAPIEVMGLYWHFVDIIWVFLLPLLYLLGATS